MAVDDGDSYAKECAKLAVNWIERSTVNFASRLFTGRFTTNVLKKTVDKGVYPSMSRAFSAISCCAVTVTCRTIASVPPMAHTLTPTNVARRHEQCCPQNERPNFTSSHQTKTGTT
jgi:hypothetical protein